MDSPAFQRSASTLRTVQVALSREGEEPGRKTRLISLDTKKVLLEHLAQGPLAVLGCVDQVRVVLDEHIESVRKEVDLGQRPEVVRELVPEESERLSHLGQGNSMLSSQGLEHVQLDEVHEAQQSRARRRERLGEAQHRPETPLAERPGPQSRLWHLEIVRGLRKPIGGNLSRVPADVRSGVQYAFHVDGPPPLEQQEAYHEGRRRPLLAGL
jgi:hypothetical protein